MSGRAQTPNSHGRALQSPHLGHLSAPLAIMPSSCGGQPFKGQKRKLTSCTVGQFAGAPQALQLNYVSAQSQHSLHDLSQSWEGRLHTIGETSLFWQVEVHATELQNFSRIALQEQTASCEPLQVCLCS